MKDLKITLRVAISDMNKGNVRAFLATPLGETTAIEMTEYVEALAHKDKLSEMSNIEVLNQALMVAIDFILITCFHDNEELASDVAEAKQRILNHSDEQWSIMKNLRSRFEGLKC